MAYKKENFGIYEGQTYNQYSYFGKTSTHVVTQWNTTKNPSTYYHKHKGKDVHTHIDCETDSPKQQHHAIAKHFGLTLPKVKVNG